MLSSWRLSVVGGYLTKLEDLYVKSYWILRQVSLLDLGRDFQFLLKDLYLLHANLESSFYLDAVGLLQEDFEKVWVKPYAYTLLAGQSLLKKYKAGEVKKATIQQVCNLYKIPLRKTELNKVLVPDEWFTLTESLRDYLPQLIKEL